jgi:RimJ/RimL family protein N-acetyltransferase
VVIIDPRAYARSETLRDGRTVTLRALRESDREKIAAAVRLLDRESIYLRLFSYRTELTQAGLDRIMQFDPQREVTLLVTIGDDADEKVIGSGRYVASGAPASRAAEVAFVVDGDFRGQGLASKLLRHLAVIAADNGIEVFEADVLAANGPMLAVFTRTGWKVQTRRDGASVHLTLALPPRGDSASA